MTALSILDPVRVGAAPRCYHNVSSGEVEVEVAEDSVSGSWRKVFLSERSSIKESCLRNASSSSNYSNWAFNLRSGQDVILKDRGGGVEETQRTDEEDGGDEVKMGSVKSCRGAAGSLDPVTDNLSPLAKGS
ncbi:unnamed protein product [Nezara viridula]|uniref:Uncharacterized protein n=1 Tax=Nezara viridula TaxID=85310 RepID=A0A9P0HAC1_NEZVI|nr:unnamed protein product [Nezara viridula]